MNKTFLGWLQIGVAVFAAATSTGLIPALNPQISDLLVTVLGVLTGAHALTSGSQVQNAPKNP